MDLATQFRTPRQLAYALQRYAQASARPKLTALPYNRMDPDATTWWLCPSTDNPAYKYGKIVCTSQDTSPADLFVGLYVEKGIGPTAAAGFLGTEKGRRHVMDDTWTWNEFFCALESGGFDPLISGVAAQAGRPVVVAVDAGLVPPTIGAADIHGYELPRDFVPFHFSEGSLHPLQPILAAGLLENVRTSGTLMELAERIRHIADLDWIWIDFHAGFRFWVTEPASGFEIWDADLIWRRAAAPWSDWLR